MCAKSLQSCPILCDPVDCNLPDSSVHGILQARILEQVAMPFSRGSPQPRDQTQSLSLLHWQADSLPLVPPGNSKKKGLIRILNLVPLMPRQELYPVDQPASRPMLMVMLMAIY